MPSYSRAPAPIALPAADSAFVAIDFETADPYPDSACAVGLVRVEGLRVVRREVRLLRPPRPRVMYTHVHGITWPMVEKERTFREVWPELASILDGAVTLVAHNASFDRRVLAGCCQTARLAAPALPFLCTVQVARRTWGRPRNDLRSVCTHLAIPLNHHEAGSDAEACARIVVAAVRHRQVAAERQAAAERRAMAPPQPHLFSSLFPAEAPAPAARRPARG